MSLGFWLPPDSPYGNFQLKLMKLCQRLDEANRRLIESFYYWNQARAQMPPGNVFERHLYANEQAVYLMRRAADEMIAMIWCLSQWEIDKDYPQQIKVDCIGSALKARNHQLPLDGHTPVLEALNEIANAFKHSFVQSDITLIGRDEPYVHALGLAYNRLGAGTKFHSVSLSWLVKDFSAFYKSGMQWLETFSERHRK